jgi:hypothetical protein
MGDILVSESVRVDGGFQDPGRAELLTYVPSARA